MELDPSIDELKFGFPALQNDILETVPEIEYAAFSSPEVGDEFHDSGVVLEDETDEQLFNGGLNNLRTDFRTDEENVEFMKDVDNSNSTKYSVLLQIPEYKCGQSVNKDVHNSNLIFNKEDNIDSFKEMFETELQIKYNNAGRPSNKCTITSTSDRKNAKKSPIEGNGYTNEANASPCVTPKLKISSANLSTCKLSDEPNYKITIKCKPDSSKTALKPRKRKQLLPKSLYTKTNTEDSDDTSEIPTKISKDNKDTDGPDLSEMNPEDNYSVPLKIKQRPLCSKLRQVKTKQVSKVSKSKPMPVTNQEIVDIINKTKVRSNAPCTTNRYRRHFLKQLRKAEAKRNKLIANNIATMTENDETTNDLNETLNENVKSDDNDIREEDEFVYDNNDVTECNVCLKTFNNVGTFMAHYICHSSFEKEQANLRAYQDSCNARNDSNETTNKCVINSPIFEVSADTTLNDSNADIESNIESDTSGSVKESEPNKETAIKHSNILDGMEGGTYFCHICNKRFTNINALQSHVSDHVMELATPLEGSEDHTCQMCLKKFSSAGSLHVHNKIHTGETPYSCITCNKSFRDKTRLTTHMRVHTGEKPYVCRVCYKSFSQKGNLKLHQKIHAGLKDNTCSTCGNNFRSRSDLVRHMRVHHHGDSETDSEDAAIIKVPEIPTPVSPFPSIDGLPPYINKGYYLPDLFMSRPNIDKFTGKSNKIKDILSDKKTTENHRTGSPQVGHAHKDSIPVLGSFRQQTEKLIMEELKPDSVRNKEFEKLMKANLTLFKPEEKNLMMSIDSEVEFIKAMTKVKVNKEDKCNQPLAPAYPCPLCGVTLQTFEHLNHHILLYHNPMKTIGRSDVSATALSHNVRVPTEPKTNKSTKSSHVKKSYRCPECFKDFSTFSEYQTHVKNHEPRFGGHENESSSAIRHEDILEQMQQHTVEKSYSCDFCAKVFRRSHHLQTHMRTHTGDRPYVCTDCGKNFARGDHLQNHRRTHTGEKPYRCEECGKTYSQSHHLLRHRRTHTGERPYSCITCDKTFSRDHHLKKHMETHKVITFPRKEDSHKNKRSSSGSEPARHPSSAAMSSATMSTRSSSRIAHMIDSMATHNPASRLMENIVKKHLLGNMDVDPDNNDHKNTKGGNSKGVNESRTLQISDLLDEVPRHKTSTISNKLILDHVIKATSGSNMNSNIKNDKYVYGSFGAEMAKTKPASEPINLEMNNHVGIRDEVEMYNKSKQEYGGYSYKNEMLTKSKTDYFGHLGKLNDKDIAGKGAHKDSNIVDNGNDAIDMTQSVYARREAMPSHEDEDVGERHSGTKHMGTIQSGTRQGGGEGGILTLEDIVNQRLREEYNIDSISD